MSLDKGLKNLKYDVRLTEYNLANGTLTKQELEAYLKQLPDSANMAESLNLEKPDTEDAH